MGTPPSPVTRSEYSERLCRGGYPEAITLSDVDRQLWFSVYVHTAVTRDIVELTDARRSTELHRLLRALAARTSAELVMQDLHRDLEFGSIDTTSDYLSYLEMTYLVTRLPGWASGAATRAKRRSKVQMTDTGLAAAILGLTAESMSDPVGLTAESMSDPATTSRGPLHETFAVNELRRQASAHAPDLRFCHYRDRLRERRDHRRRNPAPDLRFCHYRDSHRREIDLLIERPDGRLIAV